MQIYYLIISYYRISVSKKNYGTTLLFQKNQLAGSYIWSCKQRNFALKKNSDFIIFQLFGSFEHCYIIFLRV